MSITSRVSICSNFATLPASPCSLSILIDESLKPKKEWFNKTLGDITDYCVIKHNTTPEQFDKKRNLLFLCPFKS